MISNTLVQNTLQYHNYDRIPMVYFNRDKEKSDIIMIEVSHHFGGSDGLQSEWGFTWERCDESMGQPSDGILQTPESILQYKAPDAFDSNRFAHVQDEMNKYPGKYYLASFGLSGFTIMTCLRGFANVLEDMYLEEELFHTLADTIFTAEEQIIIQLKEQGFHGVAFFDDWGTQENLIISPDKWREVFKPRYRRQFELAHRHGLDVYFHCCGAIESIIEDFIEIGVDMLNISQPNLFDIEELGNKYGGRICFVCPVSYQTTSISGTPEMIENDVRTLVNHLGCFHGGLIGYIEDYRIMGMSEDNYQSCIRAFDIYGNYNHQPREERREKRGETKLKESTEIILKVFEQEHENLKDCMADIIKAIFLLTRCYQNSGKILTCGNGGSASDSEHVVGELMKGFCKRRYLNPSQQAQLKQVCGEEEAAFFINNLQGALPAISLTGHPALTTAFMNDVEPSLIFAQQVLGYGNPGDTLLCFSTSGNSRNVVNALKVAKSFGLNAISFTGEKESGLSKLSDITIRVPQTETYKVQEEHIKIYHTICLALENEFFEF